MLQKLLEEEHQILIILHIGMEILTGILQRSSVSKYIQQAADVVLQKKDTRTVPRNCYRQTKQFYLQVVPALELLRSCAGQHAQIRDSSRL